MLSCWTLIAADVKPVWQRIADGTLRSVSVGYRVHRYEQRTDAATAETIRAHAILLSRVRLSGTIVALHTKTDNLGRADGFLSMAVVLAGHRIDAVEDVFLDNPPGRVEGAGAWHRGEGPMLPASRIWIVLGQDRRHITLGRTTPTDKEIAAASGALRAQGLGGWIATLDGSYWGRGGVTLAPAQLVSAGGALDSPTAVTAFLNAGKRVLRIRSFD